MRIDRCVWSENGSEVESIAEHGVTPNEVEEAILGGDGEDAETMVRRDGNFYVVLGETLDGRLLSMAGELFPGNALRVFHAMNMTRIEKAQFRKARR